MSEAIKFLKNYPRAILFCFTSILLLFAFSPAVSELLARWLHEERYSHAPLVFSIAIYLIWIKRFEINKSNIGAWYGVAISIFAGIFLIIGELSAIWTIVQYALVVICFGLTWSMVGYQIKKISVPYLHVLIVVPLPYMLDVMLSGKMQLVSSNLGVAIARLLGLSIFQEGNIIDLGIYKLQVVEACSGLNYMYPLMTIGLLIAYMYKAPLYCRAVLFLSSIPISIVMNSIRIAMVAILVNYSGIEAAEGFMHLFEGWVIFMICIALLLFEVKIINRAIKSKLSIANSFDYYETKGPSNEPLQSGVSINYRPIFVALMVILVSLISTITIHHRAEVIPERDLFIDYPMQVGGWNGRAFRFENNENSVLHLKDYLRADYSKDDLHIDVYLGYTDSQRSGFVPHSPKACIPGGGWEISDTRLKTIKIDANKSFQVTRMLIRKGESKQLIYYWFHQRGRDLSNEFPMKFALLYDAIKINRTDGAIVRFIMSVKDSEETTDQALTDFIRLQYPLFPKFIPN